jgi:hypothetical protein
MSNRRAMWHCEHKGRFETSIQWTVFEDIQRKAGLSYRKIWPHLLAPIYIPLTSYKSFILFCLFRSQSSRRLTGDGPLRADAPLSFLFFVLLKEVYKSSWAYSEARPRITVSLWEHHICRGILHLKLPLISALSPHIRWKVNNSGFSEYEELRLAQHRNI